MDASCRPKATIAVTLSTVAPAEGEKSGDVSGETYARTGEGGDWGTVVIRQPKGGRMQTEVIAREPLYEGTEALIIYKTSEAYYLAHVNARGHTIPLEKREYLPMRR